jgi:hypothetical protein
MTRRQTAHRKRSHARQVAVRVHRNRARQARLSRQARRVRLRRARWRRAPWWNKHPLQFAALHRNIAPEYGHFRRWRVGDAVLFNGIVVVPETGATRRVTLIFNRLPTRNAPIVVADGPTRSRHRYTWLRPTALCMWYPRDPPAMRWRLQECITGLIDRARVHLLREAWWRTTRSWPAPDIHREPDVKGKKSSHREVVTHERRRCWCGRGRYSECHGAIDPGQELAELGLALPTRVS